jgi:SAM-dependent methyltransferase
MQYTKQFGLAAPELNWVPSPSYILRRAALLDYLKSFPPGRVLEVGCGVGALLYDLSRLGYHGVGVEVSFQAVTLAKAILANVTGMSVEERLSKESKETYDYLISFEVLEHIKDDAAALKDWVEYVKPGGHIFLSVPAQQKKWNITDLLAGHYRRYDKIDITALVKGSGLELTRIITYGWPASWFIERLRLIARKIESRKPKTQLNLLRAGDMDRTKQSGVDRRLEKKLFPIYGSLFGRTVFALAISAQRPFYDTEFGISYMAVAKRPQTILDSYS